MSLGAITPPEDKINLTTNGSISQENLWKSQLCQHSIQTRSPAHMTHLSGSGQALTSPHRTGWPFCPRRLSLPASHQPASQQLWPRPGGSSEMSVAPGWWDIRWTGRHLHQARPCRSTPLRPRHRAGEAEVGPWGSWPCRPAAQSDHHRLSFQDLTTIMTDPAGTWH